MRDRIGCERCALLLRQDEGYSNWTVMDTSLICLKGVHQEMDGLSTDIESSKLNDLLSFGETCTDRIEGDPQWFDVDGEVAEEIEKSNGADIENDAVRNAVLAYLRKSA